MGQSAKHHLVQARILPRLITKPKPTNTMTTEHKKLWDSIKVTNPAMVKRITGKSYQGNSPKPYWIIERATETFGPVGIGWGVTVKSERFERMSEHDVLHVAVVSVWYVFNGNRSETFDQMGGTKACYMTSAGKLMVDDDAGKKSVTDAMVKCLSMIGFCADIFSGMWDDSKYVEWAAEQYAPEQTKPAPRQVTPSESAPAPKSADAKAEAAAGLAPSESASGNPCLRLQQVSGVVASYEPVKFRNGGQGCRLTLEKPQGGVTYFAHGLLRMNSGDDASAPKVGDAIEFEYNAEANAEGRIFKWITGWKPLPV